jgi:hypothetical protein
MSKIYWYKYSSTIELLYTASHLPPEFVVSNGFTPQHNEEWGVGAHLMPPAIFLGKEAIVREKYHGQLGRAYLYRVDNLNQDYFFPDFPSLVDYGAYFDEETIWWKERDDDKFKSLSHLINYEEDDLYVSDLTWRDVYKITGTVAYIKPISPNNIDFIEKI